MAFGQEHGLGEHLAILGHIDANSDDGLCDVDDLVNTMRDAVHLDESLEFLIYFVGHEADADVCLDAPGCEVEHRSHFECALRDSECPLDDP